MDKEFRVKEFSALPVADDGKTLLYIDDEVHQSRKNLSEMLTNKLDTTAFSTVSASFLTAHQVIPSGKWENASDVVIANSAIWGSETDWTDVINAASAYAYDQAEIQIDKKLDKSFSSHFYPMTGNPSGYATQIWVENELSKIGSYVVVDETTGEDNHPVVENPSTKVIYLTKQTEGKFDNYNEWIYKDDTDTFECIGETTLDLENYYKKTETSGAGELSAEFNKYLKIPTNIEANKQYAYSTTGWNEIANADQYETETVTLRHKSDVGSSPLYEVTANAGKLIYINQDSVPTTDIQQIELTLNNVENTDKPYYAYLTVTKIVNLCSFVVKDTNGNYFKPADCNNYCYLVGDGNSNQKVYLIEFLPNKTFFAHRIKKADNTKFIEVTKTSGSQYYYYVKFLTNDGYMPFIKTDQGIAVYAYKTLGDYLVFQTSPNENGVMQEITFVNNSFTVKTTTKTLNTDSWKKLSDEHGSSGTLDSENFCVYLGAENSSFNDSYTLGRNNYSEQGLNIGYNNKIDISGADSLGFPGSFNIGKLNNVIGNPGAVNIGQLNSANDFGVNVGERSSACSGGYNIGTSNTAQVGSVNVGRYNESFTGGYCVGVSNSAHDCSFTIGEGNSAKCLGVGIGQLNLAQNCGFCLGQNNKASADAISIGVRNKAYSNGYCVGQDNSAENGGYVFGTRAKATLGGISIGVDLSATNGSIAMGATCVAQHGSIVMGARNNGSGCNIIFGTENNFSASNIIGHNNKALNSNIFGNKNIINKDLVNDSALSAESYTKTGYNAQNQVESATIYIRNFVAGVGNSAEYAKNSYILGNENKVICESSADYLNVDNDGFTYLFGYKNSATRNYDMAIGYKTIASGGENIAIGAPFATITGYVPYDGGYYQGTTVNTQARGYRNIAIRSTITGINNIAYNSTLTGSLMNLTSTWVKEELSKVIDNQIKNTWVSGSSTGNYAVMQKNIIDNANIIFNSKAFNENIITNAYSLNITDKFSHNTILHSNRILISGINDSSNANNNTLIGCSDFNLNSHNIVDNLFLNISGFNISAENQIEDNILIKTTVVPCSSMYSLNENIVFNSLINGYNDSAYRGWGTNDYSTTFTRNFIFGTHVGNYIYNTFSFSDNSNSNSESYRLSNTIRTFNFGDNFITKAENSFVFGLQNNTTAINRSFVFGDNNKLYKAPTDRSDDYIMDAFVFGISNNLINECTYNNPTLENTTIFGQHNYVKSKNTCSYNYIVGLNNSITYFTNIPSKSTIINNISWPRWPEYETNSAAFQTTRNRIFGNGIKLSHGITDSFVAGICNYVIDTKEYPASSQPGNADYNSIYMFGVGNVAYDGSHQLNIGYNNETSGHFAEAIGDGIKSKEQQLIVGKCNAVVDGTNRYSLTYNNATSSVETVEPSGVIFAVGNGTYDYTTGSYTDSWGYTKTGYFDKNNNVIPTANINNEEYITRSNALIVSANGVVSANDYKTSAGLITDLIQQLENKITALETIISSNSANWVLTSQA